jgi:hypothetical protein
LPGRRVRLVLMNVRCCSLLVAALVTMAGCSHTPTRSSASFCQALGKDAQLLVLPLTTPEQLPPLIARYRDLDTRAPEEIRAQWHDVTTLIARAAEGGVTKEKQADLVNLAYSTTKSIKVITTYAQTTCNVNLNPR